MNPRISRVLEVKGSTLILENGMKVETYVSSELIIGEETWVSPQLEVGFPDKPVERFIVGDGCRLYAGQIATKNFICGDYVTIHEGVWAYGRQNIVIGHNGWFGRRVTLDAEGGIWIGNGVGVGQDTHLWSHIRNGDTLAGSRWLKYGEFRAGDDVWFVGRCTSSPANHGDRSMAMVESNLTRGMPPDTVWGGNPAKDLTEKLGLPFIPAPVADRMTDFADRVTAFRVKNNVEDSVLDFIAATFDVEARTYIKSGHPIERALIRFLLPEAKFVPHDHQRIDL